MRRSLALVAAIALVCSLAGSSLAAGPAQSTNRFVGSFDFHLDGQLVGHMNAQLWPTSERQPIGGSFSTFGSSLSTAALPTDVVFYHHDTYNEVFFNALEIGSGSYKAAFTGHFVDYFDRAATDTAEFWGQHMGAVTEPGGFVFTDSYHFVFTVGRGAFVLIAR